MLHTCFIISLKDIFLMRCLSFVWLCVDGTRLTGERFASLCDALARTDLCQSNASRTIRKPFVVPIARGHAKQN